MKLSQYRDIKNWLKAESLRLDAELENIRKKRAHLDYRKSRCIEAISALKVLIEKQGSI